MVFRNLRERFGIDDQDYQVRGCLGTAAGFRDEEVRKPQDKHGPESLSYCVSLSTLIQCQQTGTTGPSGASEDASKALAVGREGAGDIPSAG